MLRRLSRLGVLRRVALAALLLMPVAVMFVADYPTSLSVHGGTGHDSGGNRNDNVGAVKRIQRLVRELPRSLVAWDAMLSKHKKMPRFEPAIASFNGSARTAAAAAVTGDELHIHIVGLARAPQRALRLTRMLDAQNTSYTVFDAVDGLASFDTHDLLTYSNEKRLKAMRLPLPFAPVLTTTTTAKRISMRHHHQQQLVGGVDPLLLGLYWRYKHGNVSRVEKIALQERLQFGCYMSHVKLWLRLLSSRWEYMVVLEDDASVIAAAARSQPAPAGGWSSASDNTDSDKGGSGGGNRHNDEHMHDDHDDVDATKGYFVRRVNAALTRLPVDWDILWLNSCNTRPGGVLARGVRQYRGGSCTLGYVISRKGAYGLATRRALKEDRHVDIMMAQDTCLGRTSSWMCDPPLIMWQDGAESTLAYKKRRKLI